MGFETFNSRMGKRSRKLNDNKVKGIRIDWKDPKNLDRIKVRCRGIHDNFTDDQLPIAMPKKGFGSGAGGMGASNVPPVGAEVSITFRDNSLYHPEYEGGMPSDKRKMQELGDGKPGFIDQMGNMFRSDFSDGKNTLEIVHASGAKVTIDKDGVMEISAKVIKKINITDGIDNKSLVIAAKKGIYLYSEQRIHMEAPQITSEEKEPDVKATALQPRQKPQMTPVDGKDKL